VRTNRIRAAAAFGWLGLALASNARAVDLRDRDRKYELASERFLVLASFNNEAGLDQEAQLVWRRSVPCVRGVGVGNRDSGDPS
jgi:hypothetical protein